MRPVPIPVRRNLQCVLWFYRFADCRNDYVIVKLENVAEEIGYVYKAINGVDIPRQYPEPKDKLDKALVWQQLRTVPYKLLHDTLNNFYSDDYEAFGYRIPTESEYLANINQYNL